MTAVDAWGVVSIPALLVATWVAGWRGGVVSMLIGVSGLLLVVDAVPWQQPVRLVAWLLAHSVAVVLAHVGGQARSDRREEKQIQREQASRASEAMNERRTQFLAHASEVLASSADYETTLAAVASLAVPQIADLCVIDVVDDEGVFRPVAIAHVNPATVPLVKELRRMHPLDPAARFGPPRVLRSGRSMIQTEVADAPVAHPSIQLSDMRVAVALGIRSTMAVPLLVGGRRLGVISFATTDSGRRYVATDLRFAEDLARRAAIAIDTATP